MEVQGKIIAVLPIKSGTSSSGKQWTTQEYVLEIGGQYPKHVCFEVFGDKIGEFGIQLGDELNVSFDIDARQWKDRWFNSVKAYKVNHLSSEQPQQPQQQQPKEAEIFPPKQEEKQEPIQGAEDLPF
jgi:hypothetical protein